MTAQDLHKFYVRSDAGQIDSHYDNLTTVAESSGPPVITHYNLFRAVEIDGSPAPGYSSGQRHHGNGGSSETEHDAGHTLRVDGLTLDEIESSGRALLIFGLGILVVYLTLSAQYESFCAALHYFAGRADGGALVRWDSVSLRGLSNDVYCPDRPGDAGLSAKNRNS